MLGYKPATTPSREAASLTGSGCFEAVGVAPVPNLVGKPSEVPCESAAIRAVEVLVGALLVCCPREAGRCKQKRQGQSQARDHQHSSITAPWPRRSPVGHTFAREKKPTQRRQILTVHFNVQRPLRFGGCVLKGWERPRLQGGCSRG